MYLYNIGYTTHDGSEYVQMWHCHKFSKRQLEQKIQIATAQALEYAVEHAEDFFYRDVRINFQDLFERVIIELRGLGFTPVIFTAQFEIDGFNPIVVFEKGFERVNPTLERLRKSLPEGLKNKVLSVSQKISDDIGPKTKPKTIIR